MLDADVLIIGSGAAGMLAALESSQTAKVVMISKGSFGRDGATISAQADIAVDSKSCSKLLGLTRGDESDSADFFAADMLQEGSDLGDAELIDIHTHSIPKEIKKLVKLGLKLRGLEHNPGHRYPRSVYISAVELCNILRKEISHRQVFTFQYTVACDLVIRDGQVLGVIALDMLTRSLMEFRAKVTVLCTGGGMRLYPYSTAPCGLTGDGLAMAYRAGAEMSDMEFPMFLPYSLLLPRLLQGATFTHELAMLTGAHALNKRGERYLEKWDSIHMERTTRDINAVAAGMEIITGNGSPNGGTWLSLAHLPRNLINNIVSSLPEGLNNWRDGGFDLKKLLPNLSYDALETIPAAHFWNGGIVIDKDCKTSVPGLLAAGEGTAGLHGANRISGNGLAHAIVWGVRAGRTAAKIALKQRYVLSKGDGDNIAQISENVLKPLHKKSGCSPIELAKIIRTKAWQSISLVRNGHDINSFLVDLRGLYIEAEEQCIRSNTSVWNAELLVALQNVNMLDIAKVTATSAYLREESRGAHYRTDYPQTDGKWVQNVVIQKKSEKDFFSICRAKNSVAAKGNSITRTYGDKKYYENSD